MTNTIAFNLFTSTLSSRKGSAFRRIGHNMAVYLNLSRRHFVTLLTLPTKTIRSKIVLDRTVVRDGYRENIRRRRMANDINTAVNHTPRVYRGIKPGPTLR